MRREERRVRKASAWSLKGRGQRTESSPDELMVEGAAGIGMIEGAAGIGMVEGAAGIGMAVNAAPSGGAAVTGGSDFDLLVLTILLESRMNRSTQYDREIEQFRNRKR